MACEQDYLNNCPNLRLGVSESGTINHDRWPLSFLDPQPGHQIKLTIRSAGPGRGATRAPWNRARSTALGPVRPSGLPDRRWAMTRQWYYGRGAEITGPVSDRELFDLAGGGHILPTDTVWRDQIESGVPASRVKNLFPPDRIASVPVLEAPAAATHHSPEPAAVVEALPVVVPAPAKKTGRAVAGK